MKRPSVQVLFALAAAFMGLIPPNAHALAAIESSTPLRFSQEHFRVLIQTLLGDDTHAFARTTPEVLVAESPLPNAYARIDGTIVLTRGLLDMVQTEDELAFIISHEIGHLILHQRTETAALDTSSHRLLGPTPSATREQVQKSLIHREIEADRFASQLLTKSALNPAVGAAFLKRLGLWGAEFGAPLVDSRPSLRARIDALQ